MPFFRGSFWPMDQTRVSCIAGRFLTIWATREADYEMPQFSSVQSLSCVRLFATPWTAARQASLSITTNSQCLSKLMSTELMMPSNHLILCHPPILLPSIFPSVRIFSNGSALHIRWPKYWNFSFNISPSNEHSGLISFRMDWLDLLAVQGTFKSLLQQENKPDCILGLFFGYNPCSLLPVLSHAGSVPLVKECGLQHEIYKIVHTQGSDH